MMSDKKEEMERCKKCGEILLKCKCAEEKLEK